VSKSSELHKTIVGKLRQQNHSKLLKLLIACFETDGKAGVEEKIREILEDIEKE